MNRVQNFGGDIISPIQRLNSALADLKLKANAFTLAEVLITLAIIGVVAALTIPSIITNYKRNELQTQFKKAYNILSQAGMQMKADGVVKDFGPNSDINGDGKVTTADASYVQAWYGDMSPYYKYFKVIKYDDNIEEEYDDDDNFLNPGFVAYSGKVTTSSYNFGPYLYTKGVTLSDGLWLRLKSDPNCILHSLLAGWAHPYCFLTAVVDINGKEKKPNKIGYDVFIFEITSLGNAVPFPDGEAPCDTSNKIKSTSKMNKGECFSAFALVDKSPEDLSKKYFKNLKF